MKNKYINSIKQFLSTLGNEQNKPYVLIFFGLLLGIVLTLSFRVIRYSEIRPDIKNIEPDVAYQNIIENPDDYILIDVRSEGEYARAHASSSVNLPIHYMYDDTHGIKNEKGIPLPKNKDKEIYLICTGGRLAGVAYSYLEHYGYRNIKRIHNGLAGWSNAKLPIVTPDLFKDMKIGEQQKIPTTPNLDRPYAVPQ